MALSDEDSKKIDEFKKKYNEAKTDAERQEAHAGAEAIRANYGYSGGVDGSENISLGGSNKVATGRAKSNTTSAYEDDLNKYTEAQRKSQIASLDSARKTALQSLKEQEEQIKPTYQNARNTTSALSQKNARSFGEYLANRGLSNSGAAAQGEMNRQSTLLNNLGNIDIQEANAYKDIANQRQQIENNYANGVASANANIDATYYNNLLNYNEQQRQIIDNLQAQALGRYANDYYGAYENYINNGGNPNDMTALRLLALSGNKQANLTNNAISNGANLVANGIINYNTAGGAGMSIPEATNYYNNQQAQAEAQAVQQAQLQAVSDAWSRFEKLGYADSVVASVLGIPQGTTTMDYQKAQSTIAVNNSTINKNNAQSSNYYDQIKKRVASGSGSGNQVQSGKQLSADDILKSISSAMSINSNLKPTDYVDSLYINKEIDKPMLEYMYSLLGGSLE